MQLLDELRVVRKGAYRSLHQRKRRGEHHIFPGRQVVAINTRCALKLRCDYYSRSLLPQDAFVQANITVRWLFLLHAFEQFAAFAFSIFVNCLHCLNCLNRFTVCHFVCAV
jgi:hypothetical protein